jgi:hypothetical protein
MARWFFSNLAHQKQDNYDKQNQAESTAREITPIPAVRPRRDCAEQHNYEHNQ